MQRIFLAGAKYYERLDCLMIRGVRDTPRSYAYDGREPAIVVSSFGAPLCR
jgi:hypothetical protein